MSFRIRKTSKMLADGRSTVEPSKMDEKLLSLLKGDGNSNNMFLPSSNPSTTQSENRPRCGNDKGLALRTVIYGQPDHM